MARLEVDFKSMQESTGKLRNLLLGISVLSASQQKFVCELALLRQFGVLEECLRSLVLKILCGTNYCDGTTPILLQRSANSSSAEANIRTYGRTRILPKVQWTTADAIRGQLKYLLDRSDPFYSTLAIHEPNFDEMRRIRHHIAHYNSDTRGKFRPVVQKYYGAYVRNVTPGVLLVSPRQAPPLIQQYLSAALIMVKELTRS